MIASAYGTRGNMCKLTPIYCKNITLLIELLYLIVWRRRIWLTCLSLVLTSSGYCVILYMITELSLLLSEVQEIKFPYDRSYLQLRY